MDPVVSKENTISTGPPGGGGLASIFGTLVAEGASSGSFLVEVGSSLASSFFELGEGRFVPRLPLPLVFGAGSNKINLKYFTYQSFKLFLPSDSSVLVFFLVLGFSSSLVVPSIVSSSALCFLPLPDRVDRPPLTVVSGGVLEDLVAPLAPFLTGEDYM